MSTPVSLSFRRNKVMVDEPHLQSLASLVCLIGDYNREEAPRWALFRKDFLSCRELKCFYCGRDDLIVTTDNPRRVATVDHVVPISKGGAEYDPENCVVACASCNRNKGDKVPNEISTK